MNKYDKLIAELILHGRIDRLEQDTAEIKATLERINAMLQESNDAMAANNDKLAAINQSLLESVAEATK
ncbi:MAG: hypothetical protein ACYC27_20590 [Armatimonadota bacterium]